MRIPGSFVLDRENSRETGLPRCFHRIRKIERRLFSRCIELEALGVADGFGIGIEQLEPAMSSGFIRKIAHVRKRAAVFPNRSKQFHEILGMFRSDSAMIFDDYIQASRRRE